MPGGHGSEAGTASTHRLCLLRFNSQRTGVCSTDSSITFSPTVAHDGSSTADLRQRVKHTARSAHRNAHLPTAMADFCIWGFREASDLQNNYLPRCAYRHRCSTAHNFVVTRAATSYISTFLPAAAAVVAAAEATLVAVTALAAAVVVVAVVALAVTLGVELLPLVARRAVLARLAQSVLGPLLSLVLGPPLVDIVGALCLADVSGSFLSYLCAQKLLNPFMTPGASTSTAPSSPPALHATFELRQVASLVGQSWREMGD